MKARLNTLMGQAQQELNSFGDSAAFGDTNTVRICLLFKLLSSFLSSKAHLSFV
jgi:dynamin 1-like protein